MSNTINNGGHAFPHSLQDLYEPNTAGMTLRDYFAAKALINLVHRRSPNDATIEAYEYADAMLRGRGEA